MELVLRFICICFCFVTASLLFSLATQEGHSSTAELHWNHETRAIKQYICTYACVYSLKVNVYNLQIRNNSYMQREQCNWR